MHKKRGDISIPSFPVGIFRLANGHCIPICLAERGVAAVGLPINHVYEHLYVLEGSCGISAPLAGHFARSGIVLEYYGIVRLKLHLAVIVTVEGAVARVGDEVPAACDRTVLEGGEFL